MTQAAAHPRTLVVVGAGAAGLMAAICAARAGARVVLLEKNSRPGLKILISGGGRCNLTTTLTGAELERQYGERRGRFLRHALRAYPPDALCREITAAGVPLHEEDLDKIFPDSQQAKDVLAALLRLAREAGVQLVTTSPVTALTRRGERWLVGSASGEYVADAVILATGGLSYPRTGATGDGYRFAAALGHGLVPPVPALAPLALDLPWVHELAGIVLEGVELTVLDRGGAALCTRRRPILFTHKGLSGPAPMDLSGHVEEQGGGCTLRFDFAPELGAEALEQHLLELAQSSGRKHALHGLPAALPERLRLVLCRLAGADTTLAALPREARRRLVAVCKSLTLPVERSLGFAHAEVTRGGIPLAEVDPRTMASKLVPGLHLCGEILDLDGPIGGFNFQAAFATGRLAGLSAARPPAAS